MLQDNWGKYKQPFSRRSNTIKAEVAMSVSWTSQHWFKFSKVDTLHVYVTSKMLAPLQNTVHTLNWPDIETESAWLMAIV